MKKKINYKKICLLLVVLIVSCVAINGVEAAVTSNSGTVVNDNTGTAGNIINGIADVLAYIGGMAASGVFSTITALINVLSIALFLTLYLVLSAGTGDYTHLPMPDTIVFNRFAFFDPNFINPANDSLVKGFGNVLSNLFASFHTVAIAVFIVAAMVTGLKLALSSVAAKKAQYKEAALKWISGFLVLICLKWILAAIFYINESLVAMLYKLTLSTDLKIPVYIFDAVPIFGKLLTDLFKGLESMTGWTAHFTIPGYLGIVLSNLCKSMGGNIIASVVGFVVMGQTITIVGSYLKRTFMCILLGIISPLIVAADTIMSATGKQSTIFKSWLQNFAVTVFMQSIHAMYMVVALQLISGVYKNGQFTGGFTETQASIVTIVLTTGLVKLEKMFKSLFGIGDSFAGDLKSGAKGMVQAMGAVRGIAAGAKAVGDNAGKMRDASKRKQAYGSQLNQLKGSQSRDNARTAFEAAKKAKADGNMDEYYKQRKIAAEQLKAAKEHGVIVDPKKGFGSEGGSATPSSGGTKNGSGGSGDYLQQVINNQNNPANMTREQQIQRLEEGYAQAHADYKSASLASIMGPANLAAGLGIGLGMGDDISESLFKGGMITAALDKGAEVVGYRAADKDRKTFANYEQREGEKHGYTPSEKIIREKTVIEKTAENPRLYVDPIAVGREIGKQLTGIGDVLSDTMKKELRHMDKDLDSSQ